MNTQKYILSAILILAFVAMPDFTAMPVNGDNEWHNHSVRWLTGHALFALSHANVFHLAGNLLCLYLMKIPLRLPLTLGISFVCSFIPVWSVWEVQAVCGFSGVLLASIGYAFGDAAWRNHSGLWLKRMVKWCVVPTVVTGLLPHMAMAFHLYCLAAGYLTATLFGIAKGRKGGARW